MTGETILTTYVYYDGPRLYSSRGDGGTLWLNVWAAEHDGGETWLSVRVSPERLAAIDAGAVTFREAFTGAEGGVVIRSERRSGRLFHAAWVACADIPEDLLPNDRTPAAPPRAEEAPGVESAG